MSIPVPTKTWTISPNNRDTFSSLNVSMSRLLFGIKNFLVATMGYAVKYTCDGTTGPTSSSDHTDRWASSANCTTRFNGTAGAQSFAVLTDGNGCDILFSYNGASDDIATIRYSPGGNYVPAGTATNQPTAAADEVIITAATTLVNATASLDRVFWHWASSDKKLWRTAVWRSNALVAFFGFEALTSALVSPATFTLASGGATAAVYGFFYTNCTFAAVSGTPCAGTSNSQGAASYQGGSTRVHTDSDRTIRIAGGAETNTTVFTMLNEKPYLQGQTGELILPVALYSVIDTNADGKLGNRIDWWAAVTNATGTPAAGDTYGTFNLVSVGGAAIMPWDGATAPVIG